MLDREEETSEGLFKVPIRIPRRHFLLAMFTIFLGAGCAAKIPNLPDPPQNPDIDVNGIKQRYVGKILDVEDNFQGDLSYNNPAIRNHTELVAGMYHEYYNTQRSVDQLADSVLLLPNSEAFLKLLEETGKLPQGFTVREARTRVATYFEGGPAVINLGNEVFTQAYVDKGVKLGILPSLWNPLRELRITETHEWSHETRKNSQDPLLQLLDPANKYPHKRFDGFRVIDLSDPQTRAAYTKDIDTAIRYAELDEATVELISAKPNNDLFPPEKGFYSTYPDYHGNPKGVADMAKRLRRIKDAARANDRTLFTRHANSETSQFFYLLLQRSGQMPDDPKLVNSHIQALINTIISGNPKNMQKYIDGALKYTPD